jgi:alkaline phosphatase
MTRSRVGALLALTLILGGMAEAQARPRRVILFIGDGVGASAWTAARFARDGLAVNQFRVMGLVDTRASNGWITDSGAGATAYASGIRTFNGAIGVGPDSSFAPTVLELARDQGWATGLVATSTITHATPAAFAAHVASRAMEFEIARQLVDGRVDVLLGGGRRYFDPGERSDTLDLLDRLGRSHTVVATLEELAALDTRATRRLAGFFADGQMPPARDRAPSLGDMTRAAIEVLANDPDGFFLMVEGSQPDWRAHDNEPLDAVAAEMLDFDRAIGIALDFQRTDPTTLILVVADHETGGLAIETAANGNDSLVARYTTKGHTGQMVPLFASGPGAERFGGMIDNHRVGQLLMELVRR